MLAITRFFQNILSVIQGVFKGEVHFLCDDCKYDYRSACHRSERPNARKCPDYKRR
ncbi:hypothetical protein HY792_00125 [Candidatus Desantisbacteria bacterium]|nr:hypothetical protein [Candidatus Desantisbacteria bacterium]